MAENSPDAPKKGFWRSKLAKLGIPAAVAASAVGVGILRQGDEDEGRPPPFVVYKHDSTIHIMDQHQAIPKDMIRDKNEIMHGLLGRFAKKGPHYNMPLPELKAFLEQQAYAEIIKKPIYISPMPWLVHDDTDQNIQQIKNYAESSRQSQAKLLRDMIMQHIRRDREYPPNAPFLGDMAVIEKDMGAEMQKRFGAIVQERIRMDVRYARDVIGQLKKIRGDKDLPEVPSEEEALAYANERMERITALAAKHPAAALGKLEELMATNTPRGEILDEMAMQYSKDHTLQAIIENYAAANEKMVKKIMELRHPFDMAVQPGLLHAVLNPEGAARAEEEFRRDFEPAAFKAEQGKNAPVRDR